MNIILYFGIFAVLFFFMMRFGCGAHVAGHGHGHHSRREGRGQAAGAGSAPSSAVDPVCGMTVRTSDVKAAMYGGRSYFFCSSKCRDQFEADPAKYATGAASVPPTSMEGHHHA